jgi:superfamily II RNA helicase
VVLNTPTGSGKSLVAVAAHFRSLARGERSVYTSPIKALVSEKFFSLCGTFGAEQVGMLTGDGAVNADAPIVCCTAEILANQALTHGAELPVGSVVMDEFHYYSDRDRGTAWQLPLLVLEHATFLLMSATLGDVERIVGHIETLTGSPAVVVSSSERPVPLQFRYAESSLLETLKRLVDTDRAPIYLVHFSQREASEWAQSLTSETLLGKEERRALRAEMRGFRFDSPYGKKLRRYLEHGVGVHHAGLLPKYRRLVERLAQRGALAVISGTDTLGVGVNVPIRTVLLTRLYKYDGFKSALLTVRDFKQISGRAGRRGYDSIGYVVAQAPAHVIENSRKEAKAASGQGNRKKFRRDAPPKGYIQYNEASFVRLQEGTPEPLTPVFRVDHGMLLNMLQRTPDDVYGGFDDLSDLIDRSHMGPADKTRLKADAQRMLDALADAGLVIEETGALASDLQHDFSVFHSLALFVLYALEKLDPEDEAYPLRVLSLVEAIQESPRALLNAQRHRARGDAIGQMKAEGLDYADRMEALEEIDYPKPEADWIYDRFNEYLDDRPWLAAEHVRPKGIAREMYEGWMSFQEYVRELRLDAVEGVLLRYLSQTWKILARTVPESARTDGLVDLIAWLRAAVAHADSSLLSEWEKLLEPAALVPDAAPPPPPDISRNSRTFRARIRAEVHQLLRALSRQWWEEAAGGLAGEWTAEAVEAALAPFQEEHGRVRFDHVARLSEYLTVSLVHDHLWEVTQLLVDEEREGIATLDLQVDLREDAAPVGPMLELIAVSV